MNPPSNTPTTTELSTIAMGLRAFVFAANKHPGGASSATEAITSLFFSGTTALADAGPDKDRLIYSKGHAAAPWYGALWALGAMPGTTWQQAAGFGQVGHPVPRMPVRGAVPGMEMSTGALGQGLSYGVGLALADHRAGRATRTFVLLGDGECTEGQVWEAAMTADRLGLRNLVALVDANGSGSVIKLPREQWAARWEGFGWRTIAVDGHDLGAITAALREDSDRPTAIILNTIKGYGLAAEVEGSNTLSADVAAEHLPDWDTAGLIDAALEAIDRYFPDAALRRRGQAAPATVPPTRPSRAELLSRVTGYEPGTAVVAKKALGGELAVELAGLPMLWMAPDAIRNSGLLPRMDEVGSWDWHTPDADVLQCAIAEQDAASLAAGAASSGLWPVLFSMEGFYWRMLDQIRESIAFPKVPVLLVGTSGGLGDPLGPMVQSDGCLAALLAIGDLEVFEAADINTAKLLALEALSSGQPAYLRLPHEAVPVRHTLEDLAARPLHEGVFTLVDDPEPDLVILTAGALRERAIDAAEILSDRDARRVRVLEIVSPTRFAALTPGRLLELIPAHASAVSVHNAPSSVLGNLLSHARGGIGEARIGVDTYGIAGWPQAALYEAANLTTDAIADRIRKEHA
ncbi:thiamine pyrophosphate-dependent enzyme [Streptomyces sp. NBC_01433]|uniref:thiamine pyrophosphate-dependent enzyme n=1 Tax=Streptomyces sp. NBC_01433 TaxID=2903864 RepID=UPI00225A3B84|nr:thiamine pyrophosphate-dependent enzyme [Streptomyces sp. NBC_01433]MCX4681474.1 thiamine pyrophosphate-dependent enzyme [Streptomyces sp. NBC_01433]